MIIERRKARRKEGIWKTKKDGVWNEGGKEEELWMGSKKEDEKNG